MASMSQSGKVIWRGCRRSVRAKERMEFWRTYTSRRKALSLLANSGDLTMTASWAEYVVFDSPLPTTSMIELLIRLRNCQSCV